MAGDDLRAAFQQLTYEVLAPDIPKLRLFPTGGKDGCIDLFGGDDGGYTVIECKQIDADGVKPAIGHWKEVAEKLDRNLAQAAGPPIGQAQFRPWYRSDRPIRRYIFAVSSTVKNQDGFDQLRDEIRSFFAALATRPHLGHLHGMRIDVLDWSDFQAAVSERARLAFRWFPTTRPLGLVPIDDLPPPTGFREYLRTNRLPYYRPAEYIAELPLFDVDEVLRRLHVEDISGVVITGSGGVGKTRMGMELGLRAAAERWNVLCAVPRLRPDALDRLAEAVARDPDQRVLVLTDYVERTSDFPELVDRIVSLNATYGYTIRFAANCRTAYYYSAVEGAIAAHLPVDLTPARSGAPGEWLASYRAAVVDHILRHGGLPVDERHRVVCRGTPVLAVFLAYLREQARDDDLAALLGEQDFVRWVSRRVQMSFGQVGVSRELATLVAMFPLPAEAYEQLPSGAIRVLFDELAADRWIERDAAFDGGVGVWHTVHDVLADQILLAYCQSVAATVREFVSELLDRAVAWGTLRSALLAVQRIADQPPLAGMDWLDLLLGKTEGEPAAWSAVCNELVSSSLLSPAQTIELMDRRPSLWEGAVADPTFHGRLGALATRLSHANGKQIPERARSTLVHWIRQVTPYVEQSNYPLTWGVRLFTEETRGYALAWLSRHRLEFDAHYLLVAWLENGLPRQAVESQVVDWANRFRRHPNLSFLIRAWCEAGGSTDPLREALLAWVAAYGEHEVADFLYRAWLTAGADLESLQDPILSWVHANRDQERAVYLTKSLTKLRNLPVESIRDILAWCRTFPGHEDALWRLTSLGTRVHDLSLSDDLLLTTEVVLSRHYQSPRLSVMTRAQIAAELYYLITAPGLEESPRWDHVNALMASWMRLPQSYGADLPPHDYIHRYPYVLRVAQLLDVHCLDASRDQAALREFVAWVNTWDVERRWPLRQLMDDLVQEYGRNSPWGAFRRPVMPSGTRDRPFQTDSPRGQASSPKD